MHIAWSWLCSFLVEDKGVFVYSHTPLCLAPRAGLTPPLCPPSQGCCEGQRTGWEGHGMVAILWYQDFGY